MAAVQEHSVSVWENKIKPKIQVAGSGPPVVFLHGAYGLTWDPFLDELTKSFTVYAPEHPGTTWGDPDGIKPLDNLWDLVLYYDELFDQLKLDSPAVIGHSFGGMVAAEIAASYPRRVSKLVLLNPIGLWRDDMPVKNWMIIPMEEVVKAAFYDPNGPIAKQMLTLPEDEKAQQDAQIRVTWSLACTGKFIWPIPDKGLKKRIHRIKSPTLIVWGKHDKLVPPVYAQEFADRIAGSRVEMFDQAAHVPQLEQLSKVSVAVRDFIKS
jgi:pimeloyl-ACP methyl ester carboxylesterase